MKNLSLEIKEFDAAKEVKVQKREEEKKKSKKGHKEVLSKNSENEKYLKFNYQTAVQSKDFFGKHIAEFECEEGELIPNVLTLLFEYFDENPEFYWMQGIFWKSGKEHIENSILEELRKGNFECLKDQDDAYSIAAVLKKIFRHLGEPLCTYKLYEEFKCLGEISWEDELIEWVNKIMFKMEPINRQTFKALIWFLSHVTIF